MNELKAEAETLTLMNSIERLGRNIEKLKSCRELSESLNSKLNRTGNEPMAVNDSCLKDKDPHTLSIVELFNKISYDINCEINQINDNTQSSIDMIE